MVGVNQVWKKWRFPGFFPSTRLYLTFNVAVYVNHETEIRQSQANDSFILATGQPKVALFKFFLSLSVAKTLNLPVTHVRQDLYEPKTTQYKILP